MKTLRLLPLLLLLVSAFSVAQEAAPTAKLVLDTKAAKPGATITGKLVLTFAEGLHGYQNPPSKDYMIPVKLESANKAVGLKVAYPTGVPMIVAGETEPAKVYEGEIEFPIEVVLPKKAGVHNVDIKISYQQCDANACFPPATLNVSQKLTLKAAKPVKKKKGG